MKCYDRTAVYDPMAPYGVCVPACMRCCSCALPLIKLHKGSTDKDHLIDRTRFWNSHKVTLKWKMFSFLKFLRDITVDSPLHSDQNKPLSHT